MRACVYVRLESVLRRNFTFGGSSLVERDIDIAASFFRDTLNEPLSASFPLYFSFVCYVQHDMHDTCSRTVNYICHPAGDRGTTDLGMVDAWFRNVSGQLTRIGYPAIF